MRKRPILRYRGGKWLLAPWIISHFPPHRIYVEPFGGGGSVLLQKERAYAEVYNDKWDTVVNVFRIMRDPETAKELQRRLELTPFSRTEFLQTESPDLSHISDPIEKARLTIFRSYAGFGSAAVNSRYATGFRADAKRSGSIPAQDWAKYPARIDFYIDRLRGVVIENKDYKSVVAQHDSPETLVYFDPTYVHTTRNMKRGNAAYEYEMTDKDHEALAEVAHDMKGMCLISGYHSELYTQLFKGWQTVSKKTFADGASERTEMMWLNPACSKALIKEIIG